MIEIINQKEGSKGDIETRKDVLLSFYTRPTIPFNLECEVPNYKQNLVSEISSTMILLNGDNMLGP